MTKTNKTRKGPDFWFYARSFLHTYLPKVRNLSLNTIESYKQSIVLYVDYLKEHLRIERHEVTFDFFSRKNIKDYLIWMVEVQNWAIKRVCDIKIFF